MSHLSIENLQQINNGQLMINIDNKNKPSNLQENNYFDLKLLNQSENIYNNQNQNHNLSDLDHPISQQPIILVNNNNENQQSQQLYLNNNNNLSDNITTTTTTTTNDNNQHEQQQQQWLQMTAIAAQIATNGVRQRMSNASDQLGNSIRQFYASASSLTDQLPPPYSNIPGIVPYYHGRSNGPPPSYDDVVNPYASPPTYQSLFGQMREARKTSNNLFDLIKKLLIIILSALGCTILILFMILIPFTMIIIGSIYIDDCKVEHIPTFLLIGGIVWASKNIIHCYAQCAKQQRQHQQHQQHQLQRASSNSCDISLENSSICESLLNCVLIGWFIAGCVIVFRNYKPDFDNISSPKYCNKIVYMYTFWIILSGLIILSLFICCICTLMSISCSNQRRRQQQQQQNPNIITIIRGNQHRRQSSSSSTTTSGGMGRGEAITTTPNREFSSIYNLP